jgi:DNA-binding Lrp family transcriptional regulator
MSFRMRRGLTSQGVCSFVVAKGLVSEKEILDWASSSPPDTVRMLIRKCEREGGLRRRDVVVNNESVSLFWSPVSSSSSSAAVVVPVAVVAAPDANKVEEEIAQLSYVNDVYNNEVKGHMERLHVYNETRDTSVDVIGRVAQLEGVTVKALYERYDINLED